MGNSFFGAKVVYQIFMDMRLICEPTHRSAFERQNMFSVKALMFALVIQFVAKKSIKVNFKCSNYSCLFNKRRVTIYK